MAGTVSTPNVGQTQYLQTTANGVNQYSANTYAGNTPYGYTPISQQDYIAGQTANGNTQEAQNAQNGVGIHAPGYQDPNYQSGPITTNNTEGIYSANALGASAGQQAYNSQLTGNVGAGKEPSQIAPNVPNPFATDSSKLDTASTPAAQPSSYEQGFNQAKTAGTISPTSGGDARTLTDQSASTDTSNPNIDNFFATNGTIQATTQQLQDYLSPPTTQATVQSYIDQLANDRSYLSGLNNQLMNNKNIIAGTSQDIRDEITKANGFATNSQVLALATARNQTLIQTDTQLSDLISSATNAVSTDTSLLSDEKQEAQQETTNRMNLLQFQQKNTEDAFNAANDTYKTLMQNDPQALYNSLASDPAQAQRFTAITGLDPSAVQDMATPKTGDFADYPAYKQSATANGQTPLNPSDWLAQKQASDENLKNSEAYGTAFETALGKAAGDAQGAGAGVPVPIISSNGVTSGLTFNVPSELSPYVSFAANGVKYVDLSSLSPTERAPLAQAAAANGYKVIGNTAQAQTVSATTDAMNNLNDIKDAFDNVDSMSASQRDLYGAAFNTVAKGLQSNSNFVAANAYQAAALSIMKAITGVGGGSRGGIGLGSVSSSLPSITNSKAVNDSLIANLQQLVGNQLKTQVGVPSAGDQALIDENTAKNTITKYADQGSQASDTVNKYAATLQQELGRMPTSQEVLQAYPELKNIGKGYATNPITGISY